MITPQTKRSVAAVAVAVAAAACPWSAQAFTFETEHVSGDFSSTLTAGLGLRASKPSPAFILPGNSAGIDGGTNASTGIGDQGNLNYGRGDLFTGYLKGSHELVLRLPEETTIMGRVNWLRDFAANRTTGYLSGGTSMDGGPPVGLGRDGLTPDARDDLRFKARLMDLWISKSFSIGEQRARVRVGNQVISWGESLFIAGGINATNAMDLMRLSQPGTQLKEVVLPAPIASFATGLGHGLNLETYVQTHWNDSYMAPIGSYWSILHLLGPGMEAYGNDSTDPKNSGQWGVSLRWEPASLPASFGFYAMNYHDKTPQYSMKNIDAGRLLWIHPENRKLFGVSANMPVGNWAVGTELSYRPKDAVALNSATGCVSRDGDCWVDEKRWQWHLTGMLSLTPSNARGLLDALGAQSGNFLGELAVIHYPGMQSRYGEDYVSSGGWGWGTENDPAGAPRAAGTRTSSGMVVDFSLIYDGSLLPGWQVVPGITYSRALSGRTPNLNMTFMRGAQSANLYVNFVQSSMKWQFGVNYGRFWGGSSPFDQPYKDRDFVGFYSSYNF